MKKKIANSATTAKAPKAAKTSATARTSKHPQRYEYDDYSEEDKALALGLEDGLYNIEGDELDIESGDYISKTDADLAAYPQNSKPTSKARKKAKNEKPVPPLFEATSVEAPASEAPQVSTITAKNISTTLVKDLEVGAYFKTSSGKSTYTVKEKTEEYLLCLCQPEGKKAWNWKMKGAELNKTAILI